MYSSKTSFILAKYFQSILIEFIFLHVWKDIHTLHNCRWSCRDLLSSSSARSFVILYIFILNVQFTRKNSSFLLDSLLDNIPTSELIPSKLPLWFIQLKILWRIAQNEMIVRHNYLISVNDLLTTRSKTREGYFHSLHHVLLLFNLRENAREIKEENLSIFFISFVLLSAIVWLITKYFVEYVENFHFYCYSFRSQQQNIR